MRLISLSAMVGEVMAPLVLILPRTVGGIVSTIVCPLVLMSPAAGIVVLRYKIVCLLVRTYDFWFFFVMSTATLIILAIQVGDVRVAYIPSIWFGMLPHFFVDGALRGVRQMVSIGTIAAMAYLAMLVVVTFGLIPQAPAVTIFRYNKHEVPSDAIISSGFVTVLAMYLRNIYRKLMVLRKRGKSTLVECVSYRTSLRLSLTSGPHPSFSIVPQKTRSRLSSGSMHKQKLRCLRPIKEVDSRQAISTATFQLMLTHSRLARPLMRAILLTAAVLTVIAVPVDQLRQTNAIHNLFPSFQVTALVLTSLGCIASLLLYQCHLLFVLLISFDFVYLAIQIVIAHVCLCGFLQWSSPCLVVRASCLWVAWVMCIDALLPSTRAIIGIPSRLPTIVFSLFILAMLYVIYYLVFANTEASRYDLVLWSSVVLGRSDEFRLTPVFYNCLATLLPWSFRLLYRLWRCENNVLVMVAGSVVYGNYMRKTRERVYSRTWKTVLAEEERNQLQKSATTPSEPPTANKSTHKSKITGA